MRLNIQLFATSGTITGTSTASSCSCRLVWSETARDTSTGSITIKVSTQIYKSGSGTTTGTFSGTLSINGTSYSISKYFSPYNYGKWAEVGSKTVTIANASSKKVAISTSLTQGGTTMAGTYKASGTAQLDTLFNPPVIGGLTLAENNPNLTGKITNNQIVENASYSTFSLYATYYSGASLKSWSIKNGSNVFTSTTGQINIDFSSMQVEKTSNTIVGLEIEVIDTNNSSVKIYEEYDLIPYTKANIIETSTYVKRLGQTTGKVSLNVKGNFYNGTIGSINQTGNYKPTIKYRFWKYGDTPTETYTTVNSNNVVVEDGSFAINNLEIGSTTESSANYFDPDYSYRFEIVVNDNISTYTSAEKTLQRGIPLWAEYEDRVDFQKLTVKGEEIKQITESSGTGVISKTSGSITVNSSSYTKYGKVVSMYFQVTTSASVSSGSNLGVVKINNSSLLPNVNSDGTTFVGFTGSRPVIGSFDASGNMTLRNAGSTAIASSNSIGLRGTYISRN